MLTIGPRRNAVPAGAIRSGRMDTSRHGFDATLPPHFFAGHYVGQDPGTLTDALIATRKFFDERLMLKRQPERT